MQRIAHGSEQTHWRMGTSAAPRRPSGRRCRPCDDRGTRDKIPGACARSRPPSHACSARMQVGRASPPDALEPARRALADVRPARRADVEPVVDHAVAVVVEVVADLLGRPDRADALERAAHARERAGPALAGVDAAARAAVGIALVAVVVEPVAALGARCARRPARSRPLTPCGSPRGSRGPRRARGRRGPSASRGAPPSRPGTSPSRGCSSPARCRRTR